MKYSISIYISCTAALILLCTACAKRPLTSPLFRQSGRVRIYLPTQKEEQAATLAEHVDYHTQIDTLNKSKSSSTDSKKNADIKSYNLDPFTIVAQRPSVKISTIRNGRINLSFLLTLPQHFLDERYQIVLSPKLINGDKELTLPPLVLQGKQFKQKQEAEYAKYQAFEQSIVPAHKLDSAYFDKALHQSFIAQLQKSYLKSYEQDFKLQLSYDRWLRIMQERMIDYQARVEGAYDANLASKRLKMLREAYQLNLYGEDSSRLVQSFDSIYTTQRREQTIAKKLRHLELRDVPPAYRTLHKYKLNLDSLRNKSLTEEDSLTVAQHTYRYKAIAHNNAKDKNRDIFHKHLISLRKVEPSHRTDSITLGRDFTYLYSEDIPVTEDLQRRLRLTLETRVVATDQSTWWQASRDTLSYVVSGMNDLVDPKQIERLSGQEFAEYKHALERLAVRDYRGALDIFNRYPDYNAALCLIALGYNKQAETFLDYLKPANGKVDYLKAIVQLRLGNEEQAQTFLLSAARKDPQMGFRSEIDPEFAPLYKHKPKLLQQVLHISSGDDAPEDL